MTEVWRTIPGFGGIYQASTEGRIRRLYKTREPRVLKIIENRGSCRNQCVVNAYSPDGHRQQYTVLRLVAMAFYPGQAEGKNVVHRNGLHHDNTPGNALIIDQAATGQRCGSRGRRKGVCLVNGSGEIMEAWPSMHAASKATGISRETIRNDWRREHGKRYAGPGPGLRTLLAARQLPGRPAGGLLHDVDFQGTGPERAGPERPMATRRGSHQRFVSVR